MTEYHAIYYAHELSRQHSLNDSEKLATALADAQVDLNPHQLDAALFAFRSPLSKGSILADEILEGDQSSFPVFYRPCKKLPVV